MLCNKGYVTMPGYHCFNSCVANYLKFKGIMIDEIDLFLKSKEYEIDILEDGIIIYCLQKNTFSMLDDVGIPHELKKIRHGKNAKRILSGFIRNEDFVTVFLKANCLKYKNVFMYANDVNHCVNVIGMDENDRVLISDGCVAGFKAACFEGWIGFDELMNAWKNANYSYVIYHFDEMGSRPNENREYCVSDIFPQYISDNEKVTDVLIDVIKKLKDCDDKIRSDKLMEFNNFLRVGGFLPVKNYFLGVMNKYKLGDKIAEKYADMIKGWNVINCMIIKLIYANDESKYEEIILRMRTLLDSENGILSGINGVITC